MGYIERNLIPGETILYQTKLHWIVMFWPTVLSLFFALGGLGWLYWTSGRMALWAFLLLVLAAGLFGFGVVMRKATEMAVTNKRVVIKTGLVSRKTMELLLDKVESIGVNETIAGRMLGYGTVVLHGTGGTPEPFDKMARPLEFRRQVQQQIEKLKASAGSI